MAVQLQWGLDQTVGSALSIARGVLQAANNDNVQPLAIIACEKFGNTIAMCQDTCNKIERLTAKTPEPVAIKFLRAYTGFSAADSATQLSKSQAGVQFLGLAAALVTSLGTFEGGKSLHKLLETSASDKTLLPTARQLKDLLLSLEPRLVQSGFLNIVIGYHIFLSQSPAITQEYHDLLRVSRDYPGPEGIDCLIDAFRKISRIGESSIVRVSIEVTTCISWLIAFTKWCLGLPPSIYLDDGTLILEQPDAKVDIFMTKDTKRGSGIRVSIHHAIEAPSDLVEAPCGKKWTGMVSIEEFGRWNLYELQFDAGSAKKAFLQALPLAVKQVVQKLQFGLDNKPDITTLRLNPYPEEHVIARTMSRYVGSLEVMTLHSLDNCQINDLPHVALHLEILKKSCQCAKCISLNSFWYGCKVDIFFSRLAYVCLDILSLSLYGNAEILVLHRNLTKFSNLFPGFRSEPGPRPLLTNAQSVLELKPSQMANIHILLADALELTGHRFKGYEQDQGRWIMSSVKGQVIYPLLYENLCFKREGYLALNCLPGLLRYDGDVYNEVLAQGDSHDEYAFESLSGTRVTMAHNLVPELTVIWLVEQTEHTLEVSLGVTSSENDYSHVRRDPSKIIRMLARSILLEACAHSPDTVLGSADNFCKFVSPLSTLFNEEKDGIPIISVVPVDGSDEMRLFSLTNRINLWPVVLRKKACLSCCLEVCRSVPSFMIVL